MGCAICSFEMSKRCTSGSAYWARHDTAREGDGQRPGDGDGPGVEEWKQQGGRPVESARDMERHRKDRTADGERQQRLTERVTDLDRDQLRRPEREGDRRRLGYQASCSQPSQVSSRYGEEYAGGRCGGSGSRRGGTSEGNIQLNKEISGCGSTSRLCGLIAKHAGEFNHVNVATAFRKLLLATRSVSEARLLQAVEEAQHPATRR